MTEGKKCKSCDLELENIKAVVRKRIGCVANCSGKMKRKIIAYKCNGCGKFIRV